MEIFRTSAPRPAAKSTSTKRRRRAAVLLSVVIAPVLSTLTLQKLARTVEIKWVFCPLSYKSAKLLTIAKRLLILPQVAWRPKQPCCKAARTLSTRRCTSSTPCDNSWRNLQTKANVRETISLACKRQRAKKMRKSRLVIRACYFQLRHSGTIKDFQSLCPTLKNYCSSQFAQWRTTSMGHHLPMKLRIYSRLDDGILRRVKRAAVSSMINSQMEA